jgi:hypothetical protein
LEEKEMKDIQRQVVVIAATIIVIVVNALANILPINGQNTGEIANRFEVYFQPAGYVFSIWGLIYAGMIAYSIFQLLPAQRQNRRLRRIASWYLLASTANVAWLLLWHYEMFTATMAAMAILLLALIAIYLQLRTGRKRPEKSERWLVQVPFSIYLGWISVATIANATAVLDNLGWHGQPLTPEIWTVIMLAIAVILGLLMAARFGDWAYSLVLAWAFAGIAVRFPDVPLVYFASWGAAGLAILLALMARFLIKAPRPRPKTI